MAGAPYWKGLQPVQSLVGDSSAFTYETFKAATGNALYAGQVVKLNASGLVEPVDDSNAEEVVLGVVAGLFYLREDGRPVNTREITSTVTSAAGYVDDFEHVAFADGDGVGVQVIIDPNVIYAVKATEAIVEADVGDLAQLVTNATDAGLTHTGTVPFGNGADATAGGILKILGPLKMNNTDVTYATTNITDDTNLRNDFGAPETVVRVVFERARTLFGS